ncbi:MAG: ABC transporter [Microbacteriaceae bacterium BACL25 MAG-120322-bin65]|nr:MAG: ABC transporter [Microbacteriaceae bacterium BACL25 MAG-120322-bin65]HAA79356.1 ABC transporter [Microbacteriaceae bacterium]
MSAITFRGLTKTYGRSLAVNNFSAEVRTGRVTGFLGPNGAGKSTALRCLVALAKPSAGKTRILGKRYQQLENPLTRVGVVLDSRGFHPGLTGYQNLRVLATVAAIPASRVEEVLAQVELSEARDKRVKGYSLGMKQRLSLAAAILGDPEILILDEPANGLDPAGIAWLRGFISAQAQAGKSVLVSSHQLAELQHVVDDVIIINHGTLVAAGSLEEISEGGTLEEAFLRLTGGGLS